MQIIVFKSYEQFSKSESTYNEDVASDEVWQNFNVFQKLFEISEEDYLDLCQAIKIFNTKKNSPYTLKSVVVVEDSEINALLSDFKSYKKKEEEAAKVAEVVKLKLEAKNRENEAKRLSKTLGISISEARAKWVN